ncbi:hypothetical protein, partial [Rhizobium sp. 12,4]|uniref:hypothetical protein n=1 Tax=Rhizobium sp. 12,4 TaxID=3405135 RepID=UPI003D32AD8E
PFLVSLKHLPEQVFVRAKAIGDGHTQVRPSQSPLILAEACPAHRPHRFAVGEATSASGDSKVLQICQANLREGWLKRAG